MQNQFKPVLIFAQSGRFLAQLATQAGYSVWLADNFADQDTLSAVDRWLQIPSFCSINQQAILETFSELTQDENCILICGSGIECCYSVLERLPNNIQLVGNSADTIRIIKTPVSFFALLSQLSLPYPTTQFDQPKNNENWLVKSATGLGGNHIKLMTPHLQTTDHYFQQLVTGTSGSALFLANGQVSQLISINKQSVAANDKTPYRLAGIETPWDISQAHRQQLNLAISKITPAVSLFGLNSLDFMISDQNELLILEVNPRPSASAELLNTDQDLFQHHFNACQGILPIETITTASTTTSLRYLYADTDCIIPEEMTWPIGCHDIPTENTIIKKNEPICTTIVNSSNQKAINILHNTIEHEIIRQLTKEPLI